MKKKTDIDKIKPIYYNDVCFIFRCCTYSVTVITVRNEFKSY